MFNRRGPPQPARGGRTAVVEDRSRPESPRCDAATSHVTVYQCQRVDRRFVQMRPYRWGDPTDVVLPGGGRSGPVGAGRQGADRAAGRPGRGSAARQQPAGRGARRAGERGRSPARGAGRQRRAGSRHTRGWSTPDLLRAARRRRCGRARRRRLPGHARRGRRVLEICAEHRVAVVPFAGGTSVVGGLRAARDGFAGVIALDVAPARRADRPGRGVAHRHPRCRRCAGRGPRRCSDDAGYTLGHFPQSYEGASIGGYAAARSAGQSSAGYGRFDEMVVGLVLATPRGTSGSAPRPRSAAGPDLRQLVLGCEGALGVITSVTVRIRPRPAVRVFDGLALRRRSPQGRGRAAPARRRTARCRPCCGCPTKPRPRSTWPTRGVLGSGPGGCLAIAGYEGTAGRGRRAARAACTGRADASRRRAAGHATRARPGAPAATARRTCATRCSTPARSSRRSRPRRSGRTSTRLRPP